ncbi:MAG: rhodanese-like domain-containing protein [Alphaproteobacteria bacterium]|nr:rhodanese-like domain-containing protein [Alphaproteobacteria bacterium]
MTPRRIVGGIVALGLVAWSAAMALARQPTTDAERKARVEQMYADFKGQFDGVPEVSAEQLQAMLAAHDDVVVVDVREPAEQAVSMIPGAIPATTFEAHPEDYAGKEVVAYCTIGYRSGQWAKAWRAKGVDVRNLKGSLLLWTHAGGALVHDGTPTHTVNVYGRTWDLAANGYDGVW